MKRMVELAAVNVPNHFQAGRCGDGSLYTGIATDVDRRFSEHESQEPKAAKYLRGRLPLEIVYRLEIGIRSEASKEVLRIKRMGVKGKLALVDGG